MRRRRMRRRQRRRSEGEGECPQEERGEAPPGGGGWVGKQAKVSSLPCYVYYIHIYAYTILVHPVIWTCLVQVWSGKV